MKPTTSARAVGSRFARALPCDRSVGIDDVTVVALIASRVAKR